MRHMSVPVQTPGAVTGAVMVAQAIAGPTLSVRGPL
jgi:hypothetical protein